ISLSLHFCVWEYDPDWATTVLMFLSLAGGFTLPRRLLKTELSLAVIRFHLFVLAVCFDNIGVEYRC
ncbi:hypothetical protein BgiMline_002634, partial [Biomphalaria glabrata]